MNKYLSSATVGSLDFTMVGCNLIVEGAPKFPNPAICSFRIVFYDFSTTISRIQSNTLQSRIAIYSPKKHIYELVRQSSRHFCDVRMLVLMPLNLY